MHATRFKPRLVLVIGLLSLGVSTAVWAQDAALRISVRDHQGGPIPEVYAALVPGDEPWSKPLVEEIIEESGDVQWQVPPGSYRLVVGARGYFWEMVDKLELKTTAKERREVVTLRPLSLLEGRVVDGDGEPVVGARVGDFRSFLRELTLRLSPLGEEHLKANWETVSAGDGRFKLPFLRGHCFSVWSEAPGLSPGLIDNALFKGGVPDEVEVVLKPGSSLIATWAAPKAPLAGFLQLKSKDRTFLDTLPLVDPDWIWERSVGAEGKARWESLPPGDYELFWVGDEVLERLASFTLKDGAEVVEEIEIGN
jgi:hypothetical protein